MATLNPNSRSPCQTHQRFSPTSLRKNACLSKVVNTPYPPRRRRHGLPFCPAGASGRIMPTSARSSASPTSSARSPSSTRSATSPSAKTITPTSNSAGAAYSCVSRPTMWAACRAMILSAQRRPRPFCPRRGSIYRTRFFAFGKEPQSRARCIAPLLSCFAFPRHPARQRIEHRGQVWRQRRGKAVALAVEIEFEARRVQEQALEAESAHVLVEPLLAVLLVAGERVLDVLGMDAHLVGAAGEQGHLGEARVGVDIN